MEYLPADNVLVSRTEIFWTFPGAKYHVGQNAKPGRADAHPGLDVALPGFIRTLRVLISRRGLRPLLV